LMAGRNQRETIIFSTTRDKIGVTDQWRIQGGGHGAMAPPNHNYSYILLQSCETLYHLASLRKPSFYTFSHLFLNHHRYDDERW
jgi:hypothetical protein